MDLKDLLAVLEAEKPFPIGFVQEQFSELSTLFVGVKTGWDDEPESSIVAEKMVGGFKKKFI